jgi:hypothetical protein
MEREGEEEGGQQGVRDWLGPAFEAKEVLKGLLGLGR